MKLIAKTKLEHDCCKAIMLQQPSFGRVTRMFQGAYHKGEETFGTNRDA